MNTSPTLPVFLLLLLLSYTAAGQTNNPYHLNGNASQENCNCYTLTPDALNMSGSVWNINKINLNNPFDFKFNVFLGCADRGADGVVFVLQPISTSIGTVGGGIGYQGVTPSIGITIDTWQNGENADPGYDHIAIHKDGDINHGSVNNLAGPVSALATSDNIEDCQWHVMRIIWDPATKILKAQMDGQDRVQANVDLVTSVFQGDPMVFWGFTAATGGEKNHQRVCTSLNPGFSMPLNQVTCYPEPVTFSDSSTSFGSILEWRWDFGDGTTSDQENPPPHVFPRPGNYEVKLRILGNNGCLSEPYTKTIVAGSKPAVDMNLPAEICENMNLLITDDSRVEFGTINKWNWDIGGRSVGTEDVSMTANFARGSVPVSLQVQTREGCVSDIATGNFQVLPVPSVDYSIDEDCIFSPTTFNAVSLDAGAPVGSYQWRFGDGGSGTGATVNHIYREQGTYPVVLTATGVQGCSISLPAREVVAYGTNANAGNDTTVADNQPVRLNGSGGEYYSWSPATGLSATDIPDPVAVLTSDMRYELTVWSDEGCYTKDSILIKVYKGPEIYVPSGFSPNADGRNDRLQFIPAGMTSIDYFQVYNRYGQLVYRSTDARAGWDGTFNGKPQSSGTYVWMVKGLDFNGKVHTKKGTVVLVR